MNALQGKGGPVRLRDLGPMRWGGSDGDNQVTDAADTSDRMIELQKMRVALILATSAATSKLLSRRQRVSGKEIEVMCAERDLAGGAGTKADQRKLAALYGEDAELKQALAETEQDIAKLEDLMVQVNADIAALCQS
jgi:hypothetical protein